VPFAALMALGAQIGPPRRPHTVTTEIVFVNASRADAEAFFTQLAPRTRAADQAARRRSWPAGVIWSIGMLVVVAVWAVRWRWFAAIARAAAPVEAGREVDALRLIERAAGVASPMRLVQTDSALEPGVFGVRRPILVLPRAIDERSTSGSWRRSSAHEVAHVRRRDNLAALLHMAVTAIFWFHPLVWWLGARLVDERERACDEAVVRLGHEPRVYAETILTACRLFLESPLACVSGVTGSDLSKRIERIMHNVGSEALTPAEEGARVRRPRRWRNRALRRRRVERPACPCAADCAGAGQESEFEVASVKPNKSGIAGKVSIQTQPGGRFTAENVTVRQMIRFAYQLQDSQLSGAPKWLDDDRFDIVAKAEGDDLGEPFRREQSAADARAQADAAGAARRSVQAHGAREAREQATTRSSRRGATARSAPAASGRRSIARGGRCSPAGAVCGTGGMRHSHVSRPHTRRQARDWPASDGLRICWAPSCSIARADGQLRLHIEIAPEQMPSGRLRQESAALELPPVDPNGPSIFTALQEQLGSSWTRSKGRLMCCSSTVRTSCGELDMRTRLAVAAFMLLLGWPAVLPIAQTPAQPAAIRGRRRSSRTSPPRTA
jgi:hypothetical protein